MPLTLGVEAVEIEQHRAFPEGACITLTVDWLAHNLGADENLPQTEEDVRRLQLRGRMHYDLLDLRPEQQADFLFAEFGLVVEETQTGWGFDTGFLTDKVFEIGGAQLIAFWRHVAAANGVATAHTVAVKIGKVMVEFYDANLGYFSLPKSRFRRMFCEHLKLNYECLRGRWVIQRVHGPRLGI
jgi:hypothetical protein